MTTQPAWKRALRDEAHEWLRAQPSDLVWVPCTFCGEDWLIEHSLFAIGKASRGECVLGAICDDCREAALKR